MSHLSRWARHELILQREDVSETRSGSKSLEVKLVFLKFTSFFGYEDKLPDLVDFHVELLVSDFPALLLANIVH